MVQENDLPSYQQPLDSNVQDADTHCDDMICDAMTYDAIPHSKMPANFVIDSASQKIVVDQALCPIEVVARIIGQKWTLQIVYTLIDCKPRRFCELQESLGGVNPSTLSSRLKMLEETGLVQRTQVSALPPHVEYSLTDMGRALDGVLKSLVTWSTTWLCTPENMHTHVN